MDATSRKAVRRWLSTGTPVSSHHLQLAGDEMAQIRQNT